MIYNGTHISKIGTIPIENHFAIILQGSYWQSGYDSNDPGTTNYKLDYYVFESKTLWEEEIRSLIKQKEDFKAFEVKPAKIDIEIKIGVNV